MQGAGLQIEAHRPAACLLLSESSQSGVKIEAQCKVELRGNGIYDNRGHGVITKGDSTVMENDIIGNRGSGLQLLPMSDTKVCVCV